MGKNLIGKTFTILQKCIIMLHGSIIGGEVIDMKRIYFYMPIIIVLAFIATAAWYIDASTANPGIYPIGIITGICILAQLVMCLFTVKNIVKNNYKLKNVILLILETGSSIVMGYFFVVWMIIAQTMTF